MGARAPWLEQVRSLAATMPWPTTVRVNISDMAQVMADSDLAIGAAGSTAWERCCLGLPTLLVILAENQKEGALALEQNGAARLLGKPGAILHELKSILSMLVEGQSLAGMIHSACAVTDGWGAARVLEQMGGMA
jgi:spore coat polysaccharide biosynthesis predicted glycosyltransferase SpsG